MAGKEAPKPKKVTVGAYRIVSREGIFHVMVDGKQSPKFASRDLAEAYRQGIVDFQNKDLLE